MMKADRRISALIDEIQGDVLIDVGCDHGYVTVGALLKGKVNRAIAVDISPASLNKTVELSKEEEVLDKVNAVCADGLAPITEDVDVGVIAGIGGYEIEAILQSAPRIPNKLILCPHQNAMEIRRYISGKFTILKDYIIRSGDKFYPIIVLMHGSDEYADEELYFGKNSPTTEDYKQMLISRKKILDERFLNHSVPEGKLRDEYEEVTSLCTKLKI